MIHTRFGIERTSAPNRPGSLRCDTLLDVRVWEQSLEQSNLSVDISTQFRRLAERILFAVRISHE
jgi:hypothetical protein